MGAWRTYSDLRRAEAQATFERNADLIQAAVDSRLAVYTALLTGAAAYWRDRPEAGEADWATYVEALGIDGRYPGVNGLTFTAHVDAAHKGEFLARMRARLGAGFSIRPDGDRPEYFVVTHIEPFGRTHRAVGFDIGSEPRRREAAARARDGGAITMTSPLSLVTRGATERDFLLIAPVYRDLPTVPTVEQRRKALVGWSSMGIHGQALLDGAMAGVAELGVHVLVEHVGEDGRQELYRFPKGDPDGEHGGLFRTRRAISFGGQTWALHIHPGPELSVQSVAKEGMILGLGLGLAGMLTVAAGLLMVSRQQTALLARAALDDLGEAEAALAFNEHKYRSIVQATAEGYWLIDPATRATIEVNDSLCRMLGYTADEMVGRPPTDFMDARNARVMERQLRRIELTDHRTYEITLKRKDGRHVITRFNATTLRDSDGAATAAFAFVSDVTAQRMHDREIARLQARLRQILETAGEGICGFDSLGHLVFANHALCVLSGWTEAELMGQGCESLFRFGDGETCPVAQARKGGEVRAQGTLLRRDGGDLPVEIVATPLRDSERAVGTVVVLRDVTERLAAQEVLQEREELFRDLQRSNAELEAFAYVASHDLRQPLRMVNSFLTLLERRLGGELNGDCADYLNFARDGAKRMDELILALLDYSRGGRANVQFGPVEIQDVVEVALANLRAAIADAGASVELDLRAPAVHGDRIELVRLIQNLVGNAVKYRAADRALAIRVEAWTEDGEVVVAVRDNGIGIDPQYHDRIFRIFQRLHTQEQVEGTGIGLALCRKIAEHHGGRIWMESAAGEGAAFLVALPMAAVSPAVEAADA